MKNPLYFPKQKRQALQWLNCVGCLDEPMNVTLSYNDLVLPGYAAPDFEISMLLSVRLFVVFHETSHVGYLCTCVVKVHEAGESCSRT